MVVVMDSVFRLNHTGFVLMMTVKVENSHFSNEINDFPALLSSTTTTQSQVHTDVD